MIEHGEGGKQDSNGRNPACARYGYSRPRCNVDGNHHAQDRNKDRSEMETEETVREPKGVGHQYGTRRPHTWYQVHWIKRLPQLDSLPEMFSFRHVG